MKRSKYCIKCSQPADTSWESFLSFLSLRTTRPAASLLNSIIADNLFLLSVCKNCPDLVCDDRQLWNSMV